MSEAEIQRQIMEYAKACGYLVFRMNSGRTKQNFRGAPAGTPDLLIVQPGGRVLWIEVKDEKGVVTPVQTAKHDHLARLGHVVGVARSLDDFIRILEEL